MPYQGGNRSSYLGGIGILKAISAISGGAGELALGLEALGAHGWASQRAHMHISQLQDSDSWLKGSLGRWKRQISTPAPSTCLVWRM